jgi:hypothetical protein
MKILSEQDVENVLRGGVVEPAEMVQDTWRHRVRTNPDALSWPRDATPLG